MPTYLVREFTMKDFEQVADLWRTAGSGVQLRPSDARDQVRLKLGRDRDLFLVAVHHHRIVGAVMGGWDGRRGYVYHLVVSPDSRRRGIGDSLMDELERRFRAKGALKIKCQAYADNDAGRGFFLARGWQVEEGLVPLGKELT
jgi:ribosomal protein S18 acetylase RimI-like enzyme